MNFNFNDFLALGGRLRTFYGTIWKMKQVKKSINSPLYSTNPMKIFDFLKFISLLQNSHVRSENSHKLNFTLR